MQINYAGLRGNWLERDLRRPEETSLSLLLVGTSPRQLVGCCFFPMLLVSLKLPFPPSPCCLNWRHIESCEKSFQPFFQLLWAKISFASALHAAILTQPLVIPLFWHFYSDCMTHNLTNEALGNAVPAYRRTFNPISFGFVFDCHLSNWFGDEMERFISLERTIEVLRQLR